MKNTGTPLPSWLQRLVGWSPVWGPASRAESNRPVVNPNLHDWGFRLFSPPPPRTPPRPLYPRGLPVPGAED